MLVKLNCPLQVSADKWICTIFYVSLNIFSVTWSLWTIVHLVCCYSSRRWPNWHLNRLKKCRDEITDTNDSDYPSGTGPMFIESLDLHYNDVILRAMASRITSLTIVCPIGYSGTDQWKHQSSASPAFVREFTGDRWISPHKGPVARKMFPFDDVIIFPQPWSG